MKAEHNPAALADPCPPKTRADLEWDRILDALASRCNSSAGKRLAQTLPFASSVVETLTSLTEVREAVDLDAVADPLPPVDVPDISTALDRARIGATLANEELRSILALLLVARTLRQFLQNRRQQAPALYKACMTDPALDELAHEFSSAFDPDGSLSDRASLRLESLRSERRKLRERVIRKLDELIQKHEDILQDRYWTERDGRYVLPVRADAHERFAGIVHTTSASGATVFVEPRAVVDMGNRLKMVDADVVREEQAIYAALTARVTDAIESIAAAARALAHADVRRAACQLAKDLNLTFPEIDDTQGGASASIHLTAARHPLLVLDGVKVVPSDISVSGAKAIIVSGPNAGGKTVLLKTLGLAALMVRAGLPVCAKQGSVVALFDVVLTDVGDDQNIHKNLSTFSAHVQNLAQILDETRCGALVLLDELAVGTDPREGEALAAAVLDSLCARGGTVACTTHYEGLKALALGDPRFQNASVGFDLATMNPTFQLAAGVPGASSALAVARRFGIPGPILERAERFLTKETINFELMVQKLVAERSALQLAREDAEREAAVARDKQRELDNEIARLRDKERTAISKEGQELLSGLRRAREEVRAVQARLRGKPTEQDIRTMTRTLDAVGQKVAVGGELEVHTNKEPDLRPRLEPATIRVGMRVYVPRLRAEADVVEVLSNGQVRVAAGPLKLISTIAELRTAHASEPAQPAKRITFDAAADPDVPIQTNENTIDLRGLRAHEAIAMAEQFIDRSLSAGRTVAFMIHGHGTGALRDAVRDVLRTNRFVAHSRSGQQSEGGDGVTVVWLRW